MYYTLEIPRLLETIFAFLSRKDLYRSCTRVNRQWNVVSLHVIRKKRKAEFISIPSIRDNIIFHLYDNHLNITEIVNYCKVSEIWSNILNCLHAKTIYLSVLDRQKRFLNSSRKSRSQLRRNKRRFIFFMDNCSNHCLKQDREISRCYQDILSQYDVRAEFLRLS